MKNQVLEFFKNLPPTPEAQFNEAFELYRKSPGNSFTQVRYLNAVGFTKPNLANLLYELKKVQGITDAQIRVAKAQSKKLETKNQSTIPVWEKGSKGNQARKVFCKENGIEVEKFTNVLMDAAIAEWGEKVEVESEKGEVTETGTPFDESGAFNPDEEKKKGEEEETS